VARKGTQPGSERIRGFQLGIQEYIKVQNVEKTRQKDRKGFSRDMSSFLSFFIEIPVKFRFYTGFFVKKVEDLVPSR
jgi:hypothetical protein